MRLLLDRSLSADVADAKDASGCAPRQLLPLTGPAQAWSWTGCRFTPLHYAFKLGRWELVALLLERGADPLVRDKRGRPQVEACTGLEGAPEAISAMVTGYWVDQPEQRRPSWLGRPSVAAEAAAPSSSEPASTRQPARTDAGAGQPGNPKVCSAGPRVAGYPEAFNIC